MKLEPTIISTIIQFPKRLPDVLRILQPADFKQYAEIVEALAEMFGQGKKIDEFQLEATLQKRKSKYTIHDLLFDPVVSDTNLEQQCYLLKEKRLIDRLNGIAVLIEQGSRDRSGLDEMLEKTTDEIQAIQEEIRQTRPRPEHIRDHFNAMIELYYEHERIIASGRDHVIKTSLVDLNNIISGYIPGDLIILAARPSMGKTALAICDALKGAEEKHIVFFSLEMSAIQLCQRATSKKMEIEARQIRDCRLDEGQKKELETLVNYYGNLNLIIDDTPGASISYIYATAKMHHLRGRCDMVIIDYLQLINMTQQKGENRDQAIGRVTRMCKVMALEMSIPVLLLSQLNREVEKRSNKRPMLQDLRESGNIEQDADIVMFMYRDYYYSNNEDQQGFGEVNIAKHRQGALGTVYFKHNETMTEFYDTGEVPEYFEQTFEF